MSGLVGNSWRHVLTCRGSFFILKLWTLCFYHTVKCPKDVDWIANSVDLGAVWSGSTLFAQSCLSEYFWLLAHLSRRLTRWAYSIPMVRRPSSSVVRRRPHFQTWISLKPVGQSWSNFMSSITGVGERLHKVLGQIGKCCLHASSFFFDWIIIKVADNQDRHKSSNEFDFGPDQTTNFGVTCPWMTKILHFRTWISLRPVDNLDQILCVAWLRLGKGCIMFLGRLDQNSGVHGNRKPPLTYNGENGVSTFSRLLLIRSSLYLQVTRTCIKSQMSWNFGQIGPLTTELAALEHLKYHP